MVNACSEHHLPSQSKIFNETLKKKVRVLDIRAQIAGTRDKWTDLGRLERVVTGEVDVQEEDASVVW